MAFKDIITYLGLDSIFEIKVFILILVFIGVMLFWFYMTKYYQFVNKRFKKFADKNGFEYIEDATNLNEIEERIGIFKERKSLLSINSLLKKDNYLIFNYQARFGADVPGLIAPGKNSYVVFEKKLTNPTPNFYLKSENFGDKLDEKILGFKDIDFEDNTKFSKKYFLRGKDVEEIRIYFNNTRKEQLSKMNLSNGFQVHFYPFKLDYEVQVNNNTLYVYVFIGANYRAFFNLKRFVKNCDEISRIIE